VLNSLPLRAKYTTGIQFSKYSFLSATETLHSTGDSAQLQRSSLS